MSRGPGRMQQDILDELSAGERWRFALDLAARALIANGTNPTATARSLGIPRSTLVDALARTEVAEAPAATTEILTDNEGGSP